MEFPWQKKRKAPLAGPRFVIFSHARTGSTTLERLLDTHPDIRCCSEPFNPANARRGNAYHAEMTEGEFAGCVEDIFKAYNGIKHLLGAVRFEHNRYLILNPDYRILFLHRRNFLKCASFEPRSWIIVGVVS